MTWSNSKLVLLSSLCPLAFLFALPPGYWVILQDGDWGGFHVLGSVDCNDCMMLKNAFTPTLHSHLPPLPSSSSAHSMPSWTARLWIRTCSTNCLSNLELQLLKWISIDFSECPDWCLLEDVIKSMCRQCRWSHTGWFILGLYAALVLLSHSYFHSDNHFHQMGMWTCMSTVFMWEQYEGSCLSDRLRSWKLCMEEADEPKLYKKQQWY